MAAKNSRKIYVENGLYHLYNRGVERKVIFADAQDYAVFLKYLRKYLEPKNEKDLHKKLSDEKVGGPEKDKILKLLRLNNFSQEIDLLAYCLMPNHFHFLVRQRTANGIDRFCNSLFTRYATYFNKKYLRVGRLFQDVYKAVLVDSEAYLLHLSRYIHRNPLELDDKTRRKHQETYSSLPEYLETRKT